MHIIYTFYMCNSVHLLWFSAIGDIEGAPSKSLIKSGCIVNIILYTINVQCKDMGCINIRVNMCIYTIVGMSS